MFHAMWPGEVTIRHGHVLSPRHVANLLKTRAPAKSSDDSYKYRSCL